MRYNQGRTVWISGGATFIFMTMILCGCAQSRPEKFAPQKINIQDGQRYTVPTHAADLLIPREKAENIEAYLVIIARGRFTHRHIHPDMEQLYYVTAGRGKVVVTPPGGEETTFMLQTGDLFYIPRDTWHQVFCTSMDTDLTYLCVDSFPKGKPANEPTWDSHIQNVLRSWPKDGKK
jgi:quercetin dioxygenase-like cupin family protein